MLWKASTVPPDNVLVYTLEIVRRFFRYSSDILFLHQSTGGLPVAGCKTLVDSMSTSKPSSSMTNVACETKLHSVVTSSMHPCLGNCVAIGHAVVYHARTAHAFRAGIKCRHCIFLIYALELAQSSLDIFGIFGSTAHTGITYTYETNNSK